MTITEQLKSKAEALRAVQNFIRSLPTTTELLQVDGYIEEMISSYKQLAADLRNKELAKKS